jgi:hypothetical protein
MFSVIERKPALARVIRSMLCSTSFSDRDRRSSFQTTTVSPTRGRAYGCSSQARQTDLRITEHDTDTAGATDPVFGLCRLLGFRCAPGGGDQSE